MSSITLNNAYKDFLSLPEVGWPTTVSAVLHVGVFFFAIFGIPHIANKNDIYLAPDEMIMSVELFNNSEVLEDDPSQKAGDDTPPPPAKPIYNNTDIVPDLARPEKPDDKPDKTAEKPKEIAPDPTFIKVPPKPRSKPKTPPKPKPVETKSIEPEKPDTQQSDFNNLLKDITPREQENAQGHTSSDPNNAGTTRFGDASRQMTTSDLVALNQGVQQCWNVNAGGRFAENLEVKLRVKVNRDRKVLGVEVIDKLRYATDSHFKSAADAAQWALLSPQCSTLNLPPEKYETWKSFIYVFDPSQML